MPGSARLLHLVTYNYKRVWPETLDFETAQWVSASRAPLHGALWLVPRPRCYGACWPRLGVGFCAFTLWIYLPALAPHFGQRELFLAYYQRGAAPRSRSWPIR